MTRKPTPDVFDELFAGTPTGAPVQIDLDLIDDNPYQPRLTYDPAALEQLAASIQLNGLRQPPAARRMPDGRVQLIYGHRRKRACDLLRANDPTRATMPLVIVQASNEQMSDWAWAENHDRADLTAVEEAQALQDAMAEFGWSQAELARRRGMSAPAVSNKLRLLRAPAEVQAAVNAGTMSERQAASLAPLWDLPEDVLTQLAKRKDNYGIPRIVQSVENGASSDQTRNYVASSIEVMTLSLSNRPWTEIDLGLGDLVLAPTCGQCVRRIVVRGAPRCAGAACHGRKSIEWSERQNAALVQAAGVKVLPDDAGYSDTVNFWGDDRQLAMEHGINQAPLCERLRIVADNGSDGLRIAGVEGGKLVCYHKGQKCTCLAAIKRDLAKDGKAAWKRTKEQTIETLTAALSAPTPDTLRLLAWYHAPYDERDQVASWRAEDVVRTVVKALMEKAQPYEPERDADKARLAMETLLAQAYITPPWSMVTTLAPAPDPVAQLRGRLTVVVAWLQAQTTRFAVPSSEELKQTADDTYAMIGELAATDAPDRDELARQIDAANQAALEMLDLVSAGYSGSPEISWIVNTPISDINARSSLERASADDLRWSLAVARVQTENKGRIEAIQRRLRHLAKEQTS